MVPTMSEEVTDEVPVCPLVERKLGLAMSVLLTLMLFVYPLLLLVWILGLS